MLITEEKQYVNNIKLNLKQKLQTSCIVTRGCCVSVKCGYLFTDYNGGYEKLVALNSNGNHEYIIDFPNPYNSFDLVFIDDNTVAVTTGYSHGTGVMIIDLPIKQVNMFVELPDTPFGITFDGESLICCSSENGIYMISCSDFSYTNIRNTIVSLHSHDSYVATHGDNIFYTASYEDKVSCLNRHRREIVWVFTNESVLKTPEGIAVDDKGNVFVVRTRSCNIVVISPDGKQYNQIKIFERDFLYPSAIFFDKIRKQILVANEDNFAHLYDVSYF
ncbi:unnamed protein product [Mytilus coruscus]|uniref:SMP-30/Gluconolactonase/LRE-like region domain-containing protein n=1 Tax=Mytilus coruscus TaxID=42192 RepID=A0A6J8D0D7_MYTCO|nr:unnamed protein product [Mytilus coruscus]